MSLSRGLLRLAALRSIPIRRNSTLPQNDIAALSSTLVSRLTSNAPLKSIHTDYPALVSRLQQLPSTSNSSPPPSLSRDDLLALLDVLATSGRPADLQRVEEILLHMPTVFGVQVTIDIHTAILRGLIKNANYNTIHRWLLSMPSRPTPFTPSIHQFHMALDAFQVLAPVKFIRHVIRTMRQTGCKPTTDTFAYLIRARWDAADQEKKVPYPVIFSTVLADMKVENLPYDPSFEALIVDSYTDRQFPKWAAVIKSEYQNLFPDQNSPEKQSIFDIKAKLARIAESDGIQGAINHFLTVLEPKGSERTPEMARVMLRSSKSLNDLRTLQQSLDIPLTVDLFSVLINNNIRAGNIADALAVYDESKTAGMKPDASLVHPLIKGLCYTSDPPSEEALDKALEIYHDLVAVAPPSPEVNETYDQHSAGPDLRIYQTLLRNLALSSNQEKYFPIAKELLDVMDTYGIAKGDSTAASAIIVLYMRRARNVAEALDVYYSFRSALDERGYASVLAAFSELSFDNTLPVPSLTSYFDIVKDMRRAGLEITVEVYTILLKQLALVPTTHRTHASSELIAELVATTRRVHDFLTLDAAVVPDEQVWNQLMDTYQRLGCFADALRVWETMYISGRFDHISVSIIFDACAYARSWQSARKVFSQLLRDRFSFNLHNWNTWVECLCRLGRLNDALKVVCVEMGKNENIIAPEVSTITILIKFARRDRIEADVQERLRRYLPELWEALPAPLKVLQQQ